MNISLETPSARYFVKRYQPGEIQIHDNIYDQCVVIGPDTLQIDFPAQTIADLNSMMLQQLVENRPEVILVGTGKVQIFPAIEMIISVQQQGVGIEIMSTEAAARTFNILVSEGRNVMAILFP